MGVKEFKVNHKESVSYLNDSNVDVLANRGSYVDKFVSGVDIGDFVQVSYSEVLPESLIMSAQVIDVDTVRISFANVEHQGSTRIPQGSFYFNVTKKS